MLSDSFNLVDLKIGSFLSYYRTSFSPDIPPVIHSKLPAPVALNPLVFSRDYDDSEKNKKKRVPLLLIGLAMAGTGAYLASTAERAEFSSFADIPPFRKTEPETVKFATGLVVLQLWPTAAGKLKRS